MSDDQSSSPVAEHHSPKPPQKKVKKNPLVEQFEKFTPERWAGVKLMNLEGLRMKNDHEKYDVRRNLLKAFKEIKSLEELIIDAHKFGLVE